MQVKYELQYCYWKWKWYREDLRDILKIKHLDKLLAVGYKDERLKNYSKQSEEGFAMRERRNTSEEQVCLVWE